MTPVKKVQLYKALSSRTAKPIRDPVPHMHDKVPALRCAPAGMTPVKKCNHTKRCHPGRRQPIRDLIALMRKGVPALRCAPAGMTPVKKVQSYKVLSSRTAVADPGSHCAHARGGPRSPLRFGGDDIVERRILSGSTLVPNLVTKPHSQLFLRHRGGQVRSFAASRCDRFSQKTDT